MSAKQAVGVAFIIAFTCAGVIWFLEGFERRKIIEGIAAEWSKYVGGLPTTGPGPDG